VITIRCERIRDRAGIFAVNKDAFGTEAEARLVDALRPAARVLISLVAVLEGKIVGHILFTPVVVKGSEAPQHAIALGPLAVLPEVQHQGIGSQLVAAGLEACRSIGERAVFVLGHPEFYSRFGFQPAAPNGLHYQSAEFDPYFLVAELTPGSLADLSGRVAYHSAFDEV
jgi:putative acetyltransferase